MQHSEILFTTVVECVLCEGYFVVPADRLDKAFCPDCEKEKAAA